MKKIFKYLGSSAAVAACALTLTGCVEETLPQSDMATDEIVAESTSATEGLANGMPAYVTDVWSTSSHCYFGYPAEMIVRDMLTGDYTHVGETGYSHFISWNRNQYMGQDYMKQQFHWNYYYGFLSSVNGVIRAIDEETAAPGPLGYLGTALAYRAMLYLDLARMYEFLPNDKFPDGKNSEGNTVLNLTVPIVDHLITEKEAEDNPRATREEMFAFILGDLDKAEKYIVNQTNTNNNSMPDLACVYGLKARLYMWVEQYDKAKEFARKAISAAKVAPISEARALGLTTGYNTSSDFMWCANQNSETYAVQTGIINWTSWVSNQTTFGYTGASTMLHVVMDKSMYERISDTDWRKKQWVAPAGSALEGQTPFMSDLDKETMPAYASVKFRPNAGDAEDYLTGAASAVPLMRVEEMYFIEAEAAEHVAAGTGIALLTDFMKQYRDPAYAYAGEDAIDEIVFQKRVELWGEGHTFFDIKRLDMSVTRGYEGTNWQDTQSLLNTNGRPAWTNYVIVKTEAANNAALVNFNNPDPSDLYPAWTAN
ncbi:MAG: RagB/SusD family nutrient uptake outer membrane protein [Bacteroidaceae bacterium]|nr:RagB/SusD family nutrient uptake outer membrane protein [Bacteroidaceae bacterium]